MTRLLLPAFTMLLSVSAFYGCQCCRTATPEVSIEKEAEKDSINCTYLDSVCKAIVSADSVRLYDMVNMFDNISTLCDSIADYPIMRAVSTLNNEDIAIVKFILSDKNFYISDYEPVKQPFHPNFAIQFDSIAFLASFGTGEIRVFEPGKIDSCYFMGNYDSLARWGMRVFPDEEYYKLIVKKQ
ncbi:MAG: hypothetical protein J6J93_04810 [Muribaculaceae bacterium]|nr:hypothetical protein [Muribaculaceae bacterium]